VHFFRRGKRTNAEKFINVIKSLNNITVVPVSLKIAELSAGYRHGLGLPTIDSLILATFVKNKCEKLYTNDSHFRIVKEQNIIDVIFIDEWRPQ
jgi:predicted nucleic acid-binding protein